MGLNKEDLIKFIIANRPHWSMNELMNLSLESLVIMKVQIELEMQKGNK
jgi:hypothetical protein